MTKLLFILLFFFVGCTTKQTTTDKLTRNPASQNDLSYSCGLNPISPDNSQYIDCFTQYEKSLKKLGCEFQKGSCYLPNPLSDSSEIMTCLYTSNSCFDSANNKNCTIGYDSRWLDKNHRQVICVKSFERRGGDTVEQSSER